MVDVLLIQPPIRDFYFTKKRSIPYGLASLAASLTQKGYSVSVFDALASGKNRIIEPPAEMAYLRDIYGPKDSSPFALFHDYKHFGYSFQTIEKTLKETRPFLVGISAMFTPYSDITEILVTLVRSVVPQSKIVIGGQHATALWNKVANIPGVDYVIRGEGENALVSLVENLKNGTPTEGIPGLATRADIGREPVDMALIDDLDSIPRPRIETVKRAFYQRKGYGCGVIVASRGCPMKCSYCSMGRASGIPYRRRGVEAVLDEIAELVESFNVRFIDFEDENLFLNRKWTLDLLKGIIDRFGKRTLEFRAMNGLMASTLDEEIIHLMAEAGFSALNLSLCTTNQEQLRRFERRDQKEALEKALPIANRAGLDVVSYIIVGAPFQTADDSLKDLIFLADKQTIVGVSIYYPSPSSPEWATCERLNLLPESDILTRSSAIPIFHETSRLQSVTLLRLGRVLNFLKSVESAFLTDNASSSGESRRDDRFESGVLLLKEMASQQRILGLGIDGRVFAHIADEALVQQFFQSALPLFPVVQV